MLVESYDNIIDLINLSSEIYKEQIDSFKTYFHKKNLMPRNGLN